MKYQELRAMVSKIGHVSSHDRDCSAGGGCPQHSHCEWGLCACDQGHAGQQREGLFVTINTMIEISVDSSVPQF